MPFFAASLHVLYKLTGTLRPTFLGAAIARVESLLVMAGHMPDCNVQYVKEVVTHFI